MNSAAPVDARGDLRRRWRSRNSLLWALAAIMGVASLAIASAIIHDDSRQRESAVLVIRAAGEEVASAAAARRELLALEAFAPATPWRSAGSPRDRVAPALLSQRLAENDQGRCRDILPAAAIFRVDLSEGRLTVDTAVRPPPARPVPAAAALRAAAERAAAAPNGGGRPASHVDLDSALGGYAAITMVQSDARGRPAAVYGMVVNAAALAATLFAAGAERGILPLGRGSLLVAAPDGTVLYGSLADDHRARVRIRPTGALDAMSVTAAVSGAQIPRSILLITDVGRLWYFGLFVVCTILVIIVAARTSRRELLLAQARSDFVAGVSHDLRMPLAQILLAGETLAMRRERDEAARVSLVGSIVRETRRLVGLVDNVLFVARSGAVTLQPRLTPVHVAELFTDVVESVRLAVEDAGQTIAWSGAAASPVLADRDLLRQALVNLVDNAVKYGASGQRIRFAAEQDGEMVRLFVDDDGPGIPAAERARVFEPYERLARDRSSVRTGTGLGLAVVDQIVRACGGRVRLEDAPGRGTRAVIELRAAPGS